MSGDNWERIIIASITILPVLAGIWVSNRGLHRQMNSVLDKRVEAEGKAERAKGKEEERAEERARRRRKP